MAHSSKSNPKSAEAVEAIKADGWLQCPQPRLGTAGIIVLLSLANITCPLALDMYTPAVPLLPEQFGTTAAMVNLTISGFYLFFTLGMLLFGPVSDRVGRKPVLVGGLAAFAVGSGLCAMAWSIQALIAFRLIQATGAGAVCAISTAIVKDCFKPEKRTALLSILQVTMVVGPVLAPLFGGFILAFSTWHMTFIVLAVVGVACVALSLLYRESLPDDERVTGGLASTFARMGVVAKNRGFMLLLIIASLFSVPFMAYVSVASYVYTGHFGTTTQEYTYFFAATAAISVLGPLMYMRASKSGITARKFTHVVVVVGLANAVALLAAGRASLLAFFGCMALFALLEASIRPYTTNILLMQNEGDAGSTSALINFAVNVFGVVGMGLVSMWSVEDYATGLAVLMVGSMAAVGLLWAYVLLSKKTHVKGL